MLETHLADKFDILQLLLLVRRYHLSHFRHPSVRYREISHSSPVVPSHLSLRTFSCNKAPLSWSSVKRYQDCEEEAIPIARLTHCIFFLLSSRTLSAFSAKHDENCLFPSKLRIPFSFVSALCPAPSSIARPSLRNMHATTHATAKARKLHALLVLFRNEYLRSLVNLSAIKPFVE